MQRVSLLRLGVPPCHARGSLKMALPAAAGHSVERFIHNGSSSSSGIGWGEYKTIIQATCSVEQETVAERQHTLQLNMSRFSFWLGPEELAWNQKIMQVHQLSCMYYIIYSKGRQCFMVHTVVRLRAKPEAKLLYESMKHGSYMYVIHFSLGWL